MAAGPSLRLNDGRMIPQLAFGTAGIPIEQVVDSVKAAFDAGYRHYDCAMIYEDEKEVGQGIAESMEKLDLKREDIFVTSKLCSDKHDPKVVRKACEESLKNLGLDYLDLYLIHSPVSFHIKEGLTDFDDPNSIVFEYHKLEDTWSEMEKLIPAGLVKSIGVSNFNKRQIEHLIKYGKVVPAVNQVEVNLNCLNTKLIEFCQSKNIQVEAYAPLGSPDFITGQAKPILQLETVTEIAKKRKVTPAQVVLRHALQRKTVVITKSVSAEHIRTNYDILGFKLSEEEMDRLNKCGLKKRLFDFPALANHPEYPFHEEF
ncbi:hypothetical protein Aperf_G00000117176 [Anoplocephala perfoliata]